MLMPHGCRPGLRSARTHAAAAYIASRSACKSQCSDLDPSFVWDTSEQKSHISRAVQSFNNSVSESDRVPVLLPNAIRQQILSSALDKVTLSDFLKPSVGIARRAHIKLLLDPHAGAWLEAVPNKDFGNDIAPPLFITLLQH